VRRLEQQQETGNEDPAAKAKDQQIQELDQKVRILDRKLELNAEDSAAKARETPRLTVDANGANFTSANTNFTLGLHGVLQVDSRTFVNSGAGPGVDGFLLRRASRFCKAPSFTISIFCSCRISAATRCKFSTPI